MQILPVTKADGIDIKLSSVGVRCSVHQITDKGGQTSLILYNQVEQKCNESKKSFEWCGVTSNICSPCVICSHQAADSSCGPAVGCGGRSPRTGDR